MRHATLAAAFLLLPAVPVASLVASPINIAVNAAARTGRGPSLASPISAGAPAATAAVGHESAYRPAVLSAANLLFVAWFCGVAIFLLPVATGLWQIGRLRRSSVDWARGQLIVDALAGRANVHRRVAVSTHGALAGPTTCGAVHPAIMLPDEARNWRGDELERAIVHELEHVSRCDWMTQCVAPARARSRARDDAVLQGAEATVYAEQLVKIAQGLSRAAKLPLPAMADRADLAKRVGAVLDAR